MEITKAEIENRFSYHAPTGTQAERYQELREAFKRLAYIILERTPASEEQEDALKKLGEASMLANAAIARREGSEVNDWPDEGSADTRPAETD